MKQNKLFTESQAEAIVKKIVKEEAEKFNKEMESKNTLNEGIMDRFLPSLSKLADKIKGIISPEQMESLVTKMEQITGKNRAELSISDVNIGVAKQLVGGKGLNEGEEGRIIDKAVKYLNDPISAASGLWTGVSSAIGFPPVVIVGLTIALLIVRYLDYKKENIKDKEVQLANQNKQNLGEEENNIDNEDDFHYDRQYIKNVLTQNFGKENTNSASAEWGGIPNWSINNGPSHNRFEGLFIVLDDSDDVVLLDRTFNEESESYNDEELEIATNKEELDQLIQKIKTQYNTNQETSIEGLKESILRDVLKKLNEFRNPNDIQKEVDKVLKKY